VDAVQLVRLTYLFEDLDPDEQRDVAGMLRPFAADAGAVLFRRGAPAERLYIVARGEVDLEAFGTTRGVVGEMALNGPARHTATARALGRVEGWTLETSAFDALCAVASPIAAKVLRQLSLALAARLRESAA
jgi:CRP-like cAMP-binding protein